MSKAAILLAAFLVFAGCSAPPAPGAYEFCGIGPARKDLPYTSILVEQSLVLGPGTSFEYQVKETPDSKGFVEPMPLMLPKAAAGQTGERHWTLDGYEFTTYRAAGSDLMTIWASQIGQTGHGVQQAAVIYSITDGVLMIHTEYQLGGQTMRGYLVPCGAKTLHAASFGAATARP